MSVQIEEGKIILPTCPIDRQITGIYTDVQKMQLIRQLAEQGKRIVLLANNVEELLISTDEILCIDQSGCYKMDFAEEQSTSSAEEPIIKIEKI